MKIIVSIRNLNLTIKRYHTRCKIMICKQFNTHCLHEDTLWNLIESPSMRPSSTGLFQLLHHQLFFTIYTILGISYSLAPSLRMPIVVMEVGPSYVPCKTTTCIATTNISLSQFTVGHRPPLMC